MANETTELTFVRCPSCRSLVPASAARCRICNNPLDTESKAGDGDAAKNSSRVRQKTMSASPDQIDAAIAEATQVNATQPFAEQRPTPAAPESVGDDIDPLSAYLQELEDSTSQRTAKPEDGVNGNGASAHTPFSHPEEPFFEAAPFEVDPFTVRDDMVEPVQGLTGMGEATAQAPMWDKPQEVAARTVPEARAPAQEQRRDPPREKSPVERAEPRPPQSRPEIARQEPRQELRPESRPERAPQQPKQPQAPVTPAPQRPQASNNVATVQPQQNEAPARELRKEERREEPKGDRVDRNADRPQQRQQAASSSQGAGGAAGAKREKGSSGQLFGWLVSFSSNQLGEAIELREGKFFVTASSIKPADLILNDPSVSTPHAMVGLSGDKGFLIQDLMSDRGVFVRSAEGGGYQREDGQRELRHGDWVRFGDVEFLVSLLPTYSRTKEAHA